MSSEQDPLHGAVISERYEIERRVGLGSLGSDYIAIDQFTNSSVLIKLFAPKLVSDGLLERIQTKSRSLASITNPAVLRITDFGEYENSVYVVSPFPAGQTLESLLKNSPLDSLEEFTRIAQGVCHAIHAAHELDIVHGTLSPDCLLLPEDSLSAAVYVFNFGISGFLSDPEMGGAVSASGQIIGSPEYLSPEHVRGEEITVRSDIYSLGIIFYEMLCGHPPFRSEGSGAEAVMDLLMRQASELPPPLSEQQTNFLIPKGLGELIEEMLAKDTLERPSNLSAISGRLELSASEDAEGTSLIDSDFPSFDPSETEDTLADIPAEEIAKAVDEFPFSESSQSPFDELPEVPEEESSLGNLTSAFGQQKLNLSEEEFRAETEVEDQRAELFSDDQEEYSGLGDVDLLVRPEESELPELEVKSPKGTKSPQSTISLKDRILALPKPFLAAIVLLFFGAGILIFGGSDAPTPEDQLASSFPSDGPSGLADESEQGDANEASFVEEEVDEEASQEMESETEFSDPSEAAPTNVRKIGTVDLQDIILNSRAGRQLEQSYKKLYLEAKKAKNSKERMKSLNQVNTKVVGGLLVDLREIIRNYGQRNGFSIILGSDLDLSTAPYVASSLEDPVGALTSTSERIAVDKEISEEFDQLYDEP